jgi:hypothetical protein
VGSLAGIGIDGIDPTMPVFIALEGASGYLLQHPMLEMGIKPSIR